MTWYSRLSASNTEERLWCCGCHQFGCLQVTNDIFDVTQYPLTRLAISHPLTNQRPRLPWGASQRHSSVIESSPPSSSFQTKPTLSRVRSISNFLLSSHLVCSRQGASHALPLGIVAIFLEGAYVTISLGRLRFYRSISNLPKLVTHTM